MLRIERRDGVPPIDRNNIRNHHPLVAVHAARRPWDMIQLAGSGDRGNGISNARSFLRKAVRPPGCAGVNIATGSSLLNPATDVAPPQLLKASGGDDRPSTATIIGS